MRFQRLGSLWERMGAFSRLGRLGSIIPYCVWYGMYLSKHQHKDDLGACGSVVERQKAFGKRFNAFQTFRERVGAFSRLGRLGTIIPYGMVCM